jgi:hypothetical protein
MDGGGAKDYYHPGKPGQGHRHLRYQAKCLAPNKSNLNSDVSDK